MGSRFLCPPFYAVPHDTPIVKWSVIIGGAHFTLRDGQPVACYMLMEKLIRGKSRMRARLAAQVWLEFRSQQIIEGRVIAVAPAWGQGDIYRQEIHG